MNQRDFAAAIGSSQARIASMESGSAALSRAFLHKIAATYGVSADWLLYGRGDMLMPHGTGFGGATGEARVEPPDLGKPLHGAFVMDGVEFVRVRRLDLDVSAGNGLGPALDGVADAIALPRDWMMRQRLAADLCALVKVRGDSMAPAIPDGALILVNAAEKVDPRPGIYAIALDGEALVKRLAVTSSGSDGRPTSILLVSDNPAYPPRAIAGDELRDLRIVGRVRGVFAFL